MTATSLQETIGPHSLIQQEQPNGMFHPLPYCQVAHGKTDLILKRFHSLYWGVPGIFLFCFVLISWDLCLDDWIAGTQHARALTSITFLSRSLSSALCHFHLVLNFGDYRKSSVVPVRVRITASLAKVLTYTPSVNVCLSCSFR